MSCEKDIFANSESLEQLICVPAYIKPNGERSRPKIHEMFIILWGGMDGIGVGIAEAELKMHIFSHEHVACQIEW